MANPTLLDMPIARDGNRNAIPTTDNGTTGLLSQQYGWQLINAIPPQQGGKAVKREDFNGVFNLLSNILFYAQKGWQWEFDETQDYFAGCTVKDTADGKTYVCIADVSASTTHPNADTTHWKLSNIATKDDLANYLPLTGGVMTGNISSRGNQALVLTGGNGSDVGSFLQLEGKNRSSDTGPRAILSATSDLNDKLYTLMIIPRNGELVFGEYGVQMNDLGGSASVTKNLVGNGYIKFADGRIRQWMRITIENVPSHTTSSKAITYPLSYVNEYPYYAEATIVDTGTELSSSTYAYLDEVNNLTGCILYVYNGSSVAQNITVSLLFEGV